jgi:hypothetical protein
VEPKRSVSGGLQRPSGARSVGVVELAAGERRAVAARKAREEVQLQARSAASQRWQLAFERHAAVEQTPSIAGRRR